MNNQGHNNANRGPEWWRRRQRDVAADNPHDAPVHHHNCLGIQPGIPSNGGNETQGTPNYPPRHEVGNRPGPAPNPTPVQLDTSREFLTTPFPPMEYRNLTIVKGISSAEWVSANIEILQEMRWRDPHDVPFRAELRHRIAPELWPVIPLNFRPDVWEWLTPSQRATLNRNLPAEFQTEMTIIEEQTIPPHPEEVYFRALEQTITQLPDRYAESAARIKLEVNGMFARHLGWMQRNRGAQRWLLRQRDRIFQSTTALWINSWSGRRDGIRPPINPLYA